MNITWGGSSYDYAGGIALDGSGNIYITGETRSFCEGISDAFIAKYDSSGNSVKSITWGGSDYDAGADIALDGSGNIYITGDTLSFGAGLSDAFIVKYIPSSGNIDDNGDAAQEPILGYDIILLIGFFGILSVLVAKKRLK